jgi:hypothetical protein
MIKPFVLDPERLESLEPFEGDAHHREMLSPFAVPQSLLFHYQGLESDLLTDIEFQYRGVGGVSPSEALDAQSDPAVMVATSNVTQAVTKLTFTPPLPVAELPRIAARMEARVRGVPTKAKRLSFLMIARILGFVRR